MGARRLWEAAVRLFLNGVNEVRELNRVLDEEHRHVVADEVPVSLLGIKLHSEAADVACEVGRTLVAGDGREANEDGGFLAFTLEQVGPRHVGERLVILEVAVSPIAAGMNDALRYTLMVKVENLLAQVEVFQKRRSRVLRP